MISALAAVEVILAANSPSERPRNKFLSIMKHTLTLLTALLIAPLAALGAARIHS